MITYHSTSNLLQESVLLTYYTPCYHCYPPSLPCILHKTDRMLHDVTVIISTYSSIYGQLWSIHIRQSLEVFPHSYLVNGFQYTQLPIDRMFKTVTNKRPLFSKRCSIKTKVHHLGQALSYIQCDVFLTQSTVCEGYIQAKFLVVTFKRASYRVFDYLVNMCIIWFINQMLKWFTQERFQRLFMPINNRLCWSQLFEYE